MSASGVLRGVAIGVLAAGLAACGPDRAGEDAGAEARGASGEADPLAPDFSLADLAGREVSLRGLRGKTVVIDFWATWCAPCVYQIPVLNEFYEQHRGDGVVVLGVSVDTEGRDVVAPFAEEHEIRYPVLLGDESVARRFGAPGFPSLVVVGPDGRIAAFHVGVVEREALEEMVAGVSRRAGAGAGPA